MIILTGKLRQRFCDVYFADMGVSVVSHAVLIIWIKIYYPKNGWVKIIPIESAGCDMIINGKYNGRILDKNKSKKINVAILGVELHLFMQKQ